MTSKGVNLAIKAVIILLIGAILVLTLLGAWGGFQDGTDDTFEDSQDQSDEQSSEALCALECRQDHPEGGGDYHSCVQSNC